MFETDRARGDQRTLIDGLVPARNGADEQQDGERTESFHAILAPLATISVDSARPCGCGCLDLPANAVCTAAVRRRRTGGERIYVCEYAARRLRGEHRQLPVLLQRRRRRGRR